MRRFGLWLGLLSAAPSIAFATTKGLNQIVTPDIQKKGQISFSYQQQDPAIANPSQFQVEAGLTRDFEVAVFRGFKPGQWVLNAELGVYHRGTTLLSTGFINWSVSGPKSHAQPYLIGGHTYRRASWMGGFVRANREVESIEGLGYRAAPRLLLQVDHQGGGDNSLTGGFTYNLSDALQVNPAVYLANRTQKVHGYIVLTWTVNMFR